MTAWQRDLQMAAAKVWAASRKPSQWQAGTPPVSGAYWLRDVADDGTLYPPENCTITIGTDGRGYVTHLGCAALYPLRSAAQWIGPLPVPDYEDEGGK